MSLRDAAKAVADALGVPKSRVYDLGLRAGGAVRPNRPADERRARLRRGRLAEMLAAVALMAKGYRIVGRNVKTRAGEIDIIAVRGKRLAFVEVKRRLTREDVEAAIGWRQAARIRVAADYWLAQRPRYQQHDQALRPDAAGPAPLAPPHPRRALSAVRSLCSVTWAF